MYGQLDYTSQRPQSPWTVSYFLCKDLALPVLPLSMAASRGKALGQVIKEARIVDQSLIKQLQQVNRGLPLDTQDVVSELFLALAHLSLPQARRNEREALIADTLNAHFMGAPEVQSVTAGIAHIKLMAPLVPDAFLTCFVHSQAGRLKLVTMDEPVWEAHCGPLAIALDDQVEAMGFASGSPQVHLLMGAGFSRPVAAQTTFIELLQEVARRKLGHAVSCAQRAMVPLGLLLMAESELVIAVLRDCVTATLDDSRSADIEAIVASQVALARDTDSARSQSVVEASIEATRNGVPLGSVVQTQNCKAIETFDRVWAQQTVLMTPQRLRLRLLRRLAQRAATSKGGQPNREADLDPVKAWSVNRLLQWIEGPISDEAPQRLDRGIIVGREQTARLAALKRTTTPGRNINAVDDLTESDVNLAVQSALSTTAEFFIGDIDDMVFRASALGVASTALGACSSLLPNLRDLASAAQYDDQKARNLLHRAELAIALLRLDIKITETDARSRQLFGQCLQTALANEPLKLGKRSGGVIAHPLKRSDWPWVAEQYHRSWLPWIRQITVDEVLQPLGPDQALGLYVTGKSLSSYEFDVSVHLWQRRPGRQNAAGTSLTPFAP